MDVAVLMFAALIGRVAGVPPSPQEDSSFEEKLLGAVPADVHLMAFTFSADGKRAAYVGRKGAKQYVWEGGKKSAECDEIVLIRFSPSGKLFTFIGKIGGRQFMVVNGEQGESFDEISSDPLPPYAAFLYSADECRVAYRARLGKTWFVVDGSTRSEGFEWVWGLTFSPDGKSLVHVGKQAGKFHVIDGGEKGPACDEIRNPVVFPAGVAGVAYVARKDRKWALISGDSRGPEFDMMGPPCLSPDRKTIAYKAENHATEKGSWIVVGDERRPYSYGYIFDPFFTPTGRVAYVALQGDVNHRLVIGTEVGERFHEVWAPVFNRDGSRYAYRARWYEPVTLDGATEQVQKETVVIDGKKSGSYTGVGPSMAFSPDGNHLAYSVYRGDKWSLVVDQQERELAGFPSLLTFSPDSKSVVHVLSPITGGRWVVVGSKKLGPFDYVSDRLLFSRKGDMVAFGAVKGRELWWKVLKVR